MLAALVLLFTYLDGRVRVAAAVVAGIGFGTFIDEVGKFVTSDNDYFFRPAVAVVYVVFVGVFLAIRAARRRRPEGPQEALAAALGLVANAEIAGLDADERDRALDLLGRTDPEDPLARALREYVRQAPTAADGPLDILRDRARRAVRAIAAQRWFVGLLLAIVAANVVLTIAWTVYAIANLPTPPGVVDLVLVASGLLRTALVLNGVRLYRSSPAAAFRWLQAAILVAVFVSEPFVFYRSQLLAIFGLAGDLVVYAALRFLSARSIPSGRGVVVGS
jgi:hypothetical protein